MEITIVEIVIIAALTISSYIWFKVLQVKKQLIEDGSVKNFMDIIPSAQVCDTLPLFRGLWRGLASHVFENKKTNQVDFHRACWAYIWPPFSCNDRECLDRGRLYKYYSNSRFGDRHV